MDSANVDSVVEMPCPRCGVYLPAKGWWNHNRSCRKRFANMDKEARKLVVQDRTELRPHLAAELTLAQRDLLKGRIAVLDTCFATQRVMNIWKESDHAYKLAASHVGAEQIALGVGDPSIESWVQPLLVKIYNGFSGYETNYKEHKAMDRMLQVPPLPLPRVVGADENGYPLIVQDGNIPASLDQIMRNPVLLADIKRYRPPYRGTIGDVSDGLLWRNHHHTISGPRFGQSIPALFMGHGADSTGMFESIGMSHNEMKVNFGHCELLNFSMAHRRTPTSHNMLAYMCLDKTVTLCGPTAVLSGGRTNGIWDDDSSLGGICRLSERLGITIPSISDTELQVLSMLNSKNDNLGRAQYLCTKCSVSRTTLRICPRCNITSPERHVVCGFNSRFTLSTTFSHNRDIEIVKEFPFASKWLGVSPQDHAYAGIPHFDLWGMAEDEVHNEYSNGLFSNHTNLAMRHFFKSTEQSEHHHMLDRHSFNHALNIYKEWTGGEDSHNIPSRQAERAFTGDSRILWTAAEFRTFCMHAERVLVGLIDESDPHWVCYQKHIHYLRWKSESTRTGLSEADVLALNDTIVEHHTMYASLYPDNLPPKWHYSHAHVCDDILINGLPEENTTWHVERRHQNYKECAKHNFNSSSTNANLCMLARKEMRLSSYTNLTSAVDARGQFEAHSRGSSLRVRPDAVDSCIYARLLLSTDTIQKLMREHDGFLVGGEFEATLHNQVKVDGRIFSASQHFTLGNFLHMSSSYVVVLGFVFIIHATFGEPLQLFECGPAATPSSLAEDLHVVDTSALLSATNGNHDLRLVHLEVSATDLHPDRVYVVPGK